MFTFTVNITLIINHFTSGGCPLVNLRDLSAIICRERLQDDVEEVSTELPIHRTPFEHNIVWKMLKTIPDLTSQLLDEHLKILSKNVISETWIKGSTGECGLEEYVLILKCTCVFTATKVFSMGHKDSSLKVTLIFSKPHKCLLDRRIGKEGRMSIRGGFTVTVSDLVSKRNLLHVLPSVTALKGNQKEIGRLELWRELMNRIKYPGGKFRNRFEHEKYSRGDWCIPHRFITATRLGQWSTFGTLEVAAHIEPETKEYSVVTEEDCEILKIPANNYAKLKTNGLMRKWTLFPLYCLISSGSVLVFGKVKKTAPVLADVVIVETGNIISFVAYINSGYCKIYRNIIGFSKLQSRKVKKIQKHVYMGRLNEKESFGEISVLLHIPFTCTIVTGEDVEMAIIEDKDLHALDPVTKQLMLQTAKPTFGHLSDEDVKKEYLQKEQKREWKSFKKRKEL
ncbi:hypothetical protein MJG53_009672 [Ovis ammon polii x Ovis aries]|uniref:Uncharacterized protein n=1 Tax=Ovis ammon polii x Ovis aries TaxID=2918886 RepID=A0ACB9UXB9_9CETA|nr:hypothetical protein MJG53_009672 [Ovis ammon polii x Ovis aries]